MNESHFVFYETNIKAAKRSMWAREWSVIKAQYPTAILIVEQS